MVYHPIGVAFFRLPRRKSIQVPIFSGDDLPQIRYRACKRLAFRFPQATLQFASVVYRYSAKWM